MRIVPPTYFRRADGLYRIYAPAEPLIDEDNDWLYPEDLGMDDFLPAEHYYRHLLDNSVAVPVRIECGSGCHSHHRGHELDTTTETLSNLDRALLKRVVAVAVADHQKTHGTGSVPVGLARWAEQMLAAPDVTVTADQIAAAAAEARMGSSDISDLIVVASAFDNNAPHAAGTVTVHKVATARDLQIAALAGAPDSGALTLLGEPDLRCDTTDNGNLVVTLAGYDTYDPAKGTVRSSLGDDVDCWMIDTDHDGTAFFPHLVNLPAHKRGDTNIKNLVKALGRDLDPEAEKVLCGLESQPFAPPEDGHAVAVKIITRTGAEMTAVVEHD